MNEASDSRFVMRKWKTVNDQSNENYNVGSETVKRTIKVNRCDCNGGYMMFTGAKSRLQWEIMKLK